MEAPLRVPAYASALATAFNDICGLIDAGTSAERIL